ncbi:MAG: DsbA family protein [Acidobacteria bacterium]|nr:DsbA family protein [Acidobacteriota bacterium]
MTGRIEKLTREYDVAVRWRAFPLHPETPEEGMTFEQLFAGRPMDIRGVMRLMRRTARELGLPFEEHDRLYNTRLAQELGLWAESRGRGEPLHNAVFRAYFAEGRNIGAIPVLTGLAASAGLPAVEAEEVLVRRTFKAAVDEDWAVSQALEVTAVPTFIINQSRLVGAQSYEMLQGMMKENNVEPLHAAR